MLQEVFYWVFNMSIAAAITGVVVLSIRAIRKIPRRLTVLLWAIPFLRATVPIGMGSPYSMMSLLSRFTTKTVVVYQPVEYVDVSMMNYTMAADSYFPITYKVDLLEQVFGIASVVWVIGFLAITLTIGALYITTLHEMKDARYFRDDIYISEKLTSPAVYGILKPMLILPEAYTDRDMELVLLHEKTHIRRGDNLWRMLAFFVVAVHWFDPLAWVFLKLYLSDVELSCDECVLVKLGAGRAKEYAHFLLDSKESASIFASAFSGTKVRARIENILSFKKMTWFSLTVFLGLIASIFFVLLTNAS